MIAYQNYITPSTPSLVRLLLDQGYYCSAFHPYVSTGYSRNVVYPMLGFEEFKDIDTLENLVFSEYNHYVDDLSTYQNIIDLFENKKDNEKIFNFTVTMQNHLPYNCEGLDTEIYLKDFNGNSYTEINNYLSLVKLSDSAFEYLVNYFSHVEEKTVILMFGDHQPYFVNQYPEVFGIAPGSYNEKQYITPFVLWANYDIPEVDVKEISMNYLANILFETTGITSSKYFDFLKDLSTRFPVITDNIIIDSNNQVISNIDAQNNTDLRLYEYLQYNGLFDEENRFDAIFNLKVHTLI